MLGLYRERVATPRHRLRPRKIQSNSFNDLSDHIDRRPALLLDQRDIEVALLILLDLGVGDRLQSRSLYKAGNRLLRRADLGPLALILHVRRTRRDAMHRQRQPPRRCKGLSALVGQPRRHQSVRDKPAQIVGRARLHARGDFLGKKFEQKVGHCGTSERRACLARRPAAVTIRRRRRPRRRRRSRRHRRSPTSRMTPAPRLRARS